MTCNTNKRNDTGLVVKPLLPKNQTSHWKKMVFPVCDKFEHESTTRGTLNMLLQLLEFAK